MSIEAHIEHRLEELRQQQRRIGLQVTELCERRSLAELEIEECDNLLALGFQNQLAIAAGIQELEQLREELAEAAEVTS